MKALRISAIALAVLALSGCGVQSGPVTVGEDTPTGISDSVTLFFVDDSGVLRRDRRTTGQLGTISDALTLLFLGPGGSGLHTQLPEGTFNRINVTREVGAVRLQLPLAYNEVSPTAIDQIVCTTLGVVIQSGGSRDTTVQLDFTIAPAGAEGDRTCPVLR